MTRDINIQHYSWVSDFCEDYKKEVNAEIATIKSDDSKTKKQRLFDGKLVGNSNGRYIYSFVSDTELNYPSDTLIKLWIDDEVHQATLVNCEEFTVIIATSVSFGNEITTVEFSATAWQLLEALVERLDELPSKNNKIVNELVCEGHKKLKPSSPKNKIATGAETACNMSLNQSITFIWGPPGTGKTETLAKIALKHMKRKSRILMLSYSNVSVDGAITRVLKKGEKDIVPGELIRYGYPRDKFLLNHKFLTSYNYALHKHPELLKEKNSLEEERKHLSRDSIRYVEIGKRLQDIRDHLSTEEKNSLTNAKFIATTVSKAIIDKTIYENSFDVVIFDEASMAYIPQIVFAASLSKSHFICMGDFSQLPPIVQHDENSVLNADIFQYCDIDKAVYSNRIHEWMCLLDVQYRMHPDIATFASTNMYQGLLKSAPSMKEERTDTVLSTPLQGSAIGLIDLSKMLTVCMKTIDNSRINILSALISMGLATKGAIKHEVGVITPYNAQSRLLHAMARDVAEAHPKLKKITCATVHQFQGSEKDIILYDAVDCYLMRYPGKLIRSEKNNYANRLFNVAMTRAKGKMITLANLAYMEERNLSSDLMFKKLIDKYYDTESCYSKGSQIAKDMIHTKTFRVCNPDTYHNEFLEDLNNATKDVYIDIPHPMNINSQKNIEDYTNAISKLVKRNIKTVIRAGNKEKLPELLQKYIACESANIMNPITIIDQKIVWYGVPMTSASFTSGYSIKCRPIIRYEGKFFAKSVFGFLKMNQVKNNSKTQMAEENKHNYSFADYIADNYVCDECGKAMKLQRSRRGRFFLTCSGYPKSKCEYTKCITKDMIEDYFVTIGGMNCPKCKKSLEGKIGPFGPYVSCCGLGRHTYKLDEI